MSYSYATEFAQVHEELGVVKKELTVAKARLGNAVGALIDAGTYCAGPEDIVNGIGRVHQAGWHEGYGRGEYERIALATANSELRSQLLAMEQRYGWLGWHL